MALQHLLSIIPPELVTANREVLARWTETPNVEGLPEAPSYARFVDDSGLSSTGYGPARATLGSDDPRSLSLAPELERRLPAGTTVCFLDWARQSLSWAEIFELWDLWSEQGAVVDCGFVAVPWEHSDRWGAPGWVAFAQGFDGAPLSLVPRSAVKNTVRLATTPIPLSSPVTEPKSTSFLARAKKIRGEEPVPRVYGEGERLPMLPFTLESFQNPSHQWPAGVA